MNGMDSLIIRPATSRDLPQLTQIYAHYVDTSPVTFDLVAPTAEQRKPWFESFDSTSPYRLLVAAEGEHILGYANSSRLRVKPAYSQSVETTVYLAESAGGRGVGTKLYGELLEQLVALPSLHRAFGGIVVPNDASVRLHEKLGFTHLGTFHEVGFKFDRYWDVAWFERSLR